MPRPEICPMCQGIGLVNLVTPAEQEPPPHTTCYACLGKGWVAISRDEAHTKRNISPVAALKEFGMFDNQGPGQGKSIKP